MGSNAETAIQVPKPMVPGNDWRVLTVPEIGQWQPTSPVSVVIPHYNRPEELNLTLSALTVQTYPRDLLEVVVVDDGSDHPPSVPASLERDLHLRIIYQERRGFGAPRARNGGAAAAEGSILVYLDNDMVPERQLVEAHARWHHQLSYAVTIGFRRHVDFDGVTMEAIRESFGNGVAGELFAGRSVERPQWFEAHLTRTNELVDGADVFRVMSGGNFAITRSFYLETGGMDESFDRWGGEDNEFGFRTLVGGAVVIPERQAEAWHQGPGHVPSEQELASHRMQVPKMQQLIPELSFRNPRPGRTYAVPYATASVLTAGASSDAIAATVDSLQANTFSDVAIFAPLPGNEDDLWVQRQYEHDPRVELDDGADPWLMHPLAAIRLRIPAGVVASRSTLGAIAECVDGYALGAAHFMVPIGDGSVTEVEAVATRAINRASLLAEDTEAVQPIVGELFGERWWSGPEFGLYWHEDETVSASLKSGVYAEGGLTALSSEIEALDARLAELNSRRALQLADSVGSLLRSKSWRQLRDGAKKVSTVIRKPKRYSARSRQQIRKEIDDFLG